MTLLSSNNPERVTLRSGVIGSTSQDVDISGIAYFIRLEVHRLQGVIAYSPWPSLDKLTTDAPSEYIDYAFAAIQPARPRDVMWIYNTGGVPSIGRHALEQTGMVEGSADVSVLRSRFPAGIGGELGYCFDGDVIYLKDEGAAANHRLRAFRFSSDDIAGTGAMVELEALAIDFHKAVQDFDVKSVGSERLIAHTAGDTLHFNGVDVDTTVSLTPTSENPLLVAINTADPNNPVAIVSRETDFRGSMRLTTYETGGGRTRAVSSIRVAHADTNS
ncbi:MAG: hypothetical protein OXE50_15425, partial [Chloroflexi bacterium]|nr:hypothetical protein [Chloroflexota bacterium]